MSQSKTDVREIGVGLIGYQFMGKAHSYGYMTLPLFFVPSIRPVRRVICGRHEEAVRHAAEQYGWGDYETDWRRVIERDDVDLIDISTPNYLHKEIAVAAAEAGKIILCEKPLAMDLAEAQEMMNVVEAAGVKHMIVFNYRFVPAVMLTKKMIDEGALGRIYHYRAEFLDGWLTDPNAPIQWRLDAKQAGTGALGDLCAHLIDLARYLVGEITSVNGMTETFVHERPIEEGSNEMSPVTVDDTAMFLARFDNGALGSFEATRCAGGNYANLNFEINGTDGSVRWRLNDIHRLDYWTRGDEESKQGYRTIVTGHVDHPYGTDIWPYRLQLSYGDLFTLQIYEFMKALAEDRDPSPDFGDGLQCQAVLEAVARSVHDGQWVNPQDLLA
ncbi:MAG: Gfo/Idh/MocA family protein [Candidatus Bipolaricaulia bacterium]